MAEALEWIDQFDGVIHRHYELARPHRDARRDVLPLVQLETPNGEEVVSLDQLRRDVLAVLDSPASRA